MQCVPGHPAGQLQSQGHKRVSGFLEPVVCLLIHVPLQRGACWLAFPGVQIPSRLDRVGPRVDCDENGPRDGL